MAIKILHSERFSLSDAVYLRFVREIEYGNALAHPNLVRVLDAGKNNEFLVMEFVQGTGLHRSYDRLSFRQKRNVARQLIDGLEHIHKCGFLHRDIKPNNILIRNDNVVKICDYGLLKKIDHEEPYITNTLDNLGSLLYVSENQRDSPSEVCVLDDIYSMAIILYELFSNERMSVRWKPKKMQDAGTKLRSLVVSIVHEAHQSSEEELVAELRNSLIDHSDKIAPFFDRLTETFGSDIIGDTTLYRPTNSLGNALVPFLAKSGIFKVNVDYASGSKQHVQTIEIVDETFQLKKFVKRPKWKRLAKHYRTYFGNLVNREIEEYLHARQTATSKMCDEK